MKGLAANRNILNGYEPEELAQRLLSRAVFIKDCWEWDGPTQGRYCQIKLGYPKRLEYVHRVSYTVFIDDIPLGLTIDHTCRNLKCFNPKHLEPVTIKENSRRGREHRATANRIH